MYASLESSRRSWLREPGSMYMDDHVQRTKSCLVYVGEVCDSLT
jgi:hypothetical protein